MYNRPAARQRKRGGRKGARGSLRGDSLLHSVAQMNSRWAVSGDPADVLHQRGEAPLAGSDVAEAFGLLGTYMTTDRLRDFLRAGAIGLAHGCWLTPTFYSACMAPYDLGVNHPTEACVTLDVRTLPALWGPGTSRPSGRFPSVWRGGAIEFFSPQPIDTRFIRAIQLVFPCGDRHL